MPAPRTLYDILNVAHDAEPVVIEAAYRALMKKYHPDQSAGVGASGGPSAVDINQAFAVLRDPQRRAEYDQREWRRHQNIPLVQYQPPRPPRHLRVFGWSGWIVALAMGGAVALMTMKAEEIAAAKARAQRAAAVVTEPDLRSQPSLPELTLPPAAAEIRAAAYAAEAAAAREADRNMKAPRAAQLRVRTAPEKARRLPPLQATAVAKRPQRTSARRTEEKDFLEREGYIY